MRRVILAGLLITVLSATWGVVWLFTDKNSPLFKPIERYELVNELQFIQAEDVAHIMSRYVGLSFWDVELDVIQSELTRLDWASQAQVKRHWPNQLSVLIEEQSPVARWGDSGLINQAGEVFYPKERYGFDNLVLLEGELEDSANILISLATFQTRLSTIGFTVLSLKRQLDGVWRVELLNGSKIVLDSKEDVRKLETFIAAYSQLAKPLRKSPQVYDLRYSNGFIVGRSQ